MTDNQTNPDWFFLSFDEESQAKELELLFLARKIPFIRTYSDESFDLEVPLNYKKFARREIEKFYLENQYWPPIPQKDTSRYFKASSSHLFIVLALILFHGKTHQALETRAWFERGVFSAEKILTGELPRLLTSLTLHLDDAHLLSNIFGLALFTFGVNYFLGPGLSVLAILIASAIGNLGNALFYQMDHQAAGASTAVFAALGLTAALRIKHYVTQPNIGHKSFIPLLAALGIFSLMGTNLDSDVMAHFFGFIAGIIVGLFCSLLLGKRLLYNNWIQSFSLVLSTFLVLGSWWLQLEGFKL